MSGETNSNVSRHLQRMRSQVGRGYGTSDLSNLLDTKLKLGDKSETISAAQFAQARRRLEEEQPGLGQPLPPPPPRPQAWSAAADASAGGVGEESPPPGAVTPSRKPTLTRRRTQMATLPPGGLENGRSSVNARVGASGTVGRADFESAMAPLQLRLTAEASLRVGGKKAAKDQTLRGDDATLRQQVLALMGAKPVTIGRGSSCVVCLRGDNMVSKRHAVIHDGVLADFQSTNGTYVNGQRVQQHVLSVGDVVAVGATTIGTVEPVPQPKVKSKPKLKVKPKGKAKSKSKSRPDLSVDVEVEGADEVSKPLTPLNVRQLDRRQHQPAPSQPRQPPRALPPRPQIDDDTMKTLLKQTLRAPPPPPPPSAVATDKQQKKAPPAPVQTPSEVKEPEVSAPQTPPRSPSADKPVPSPWTQEGDRPRRKYPPKPRRGRAGDPVKPIPPKGRKRRSKPKPKPPKRHELLARERAKSVASDAVAQGAKAAPKKEAPKAKPRPRAATKASPGLRQQRMELHKQRAPHARARAVSQPPPPPQEESAKATIEKLQAKILEWQMKYFDLKREMDAERRARQVEAVKAQNEQHRRELQEQLAKQAAMTRNRRHTQA